MNFSIIIPVSNRVSILKKMLNSLSELTYPLKKYEIIFVKNIDEVNISKELKNFKLKSEQRITILFEKRKGPSFARNLGVKNARFNYLVFIDDDVILPQNLLELYKKAWIEKPNVRMIGGKIISYLIDSNQKKLITYRKFFQNGWEWVLGETMLGDKAKYVVYPDGLFSGNLSIKIKNAERNQTLFDESLGRKWFGPFFLFGEDYELCLRELLLKKKLYYDPQIVVKNMIDNNRLKNSYLLKRIINGGIEMAFIKKLLNKSSSEKIFDLNINYGYFFKKPLKSLVELVYSTSYFVTFKLLLLK